jgi:hypothetical protein
MLSDAGTESAYLQKNGVVVRLYTPPAGFDPATASAAELALYDIPARPLASDLEALAAWTGQFGNVHFQPAPAFLVENPYQNETAPNAYNLFWAGYALRGGQNAYTSAQAAFYQPTGYATRCSSNDVSTWAGIGGTNAAGSDSLGQDGTEYVNTPQYLSFEEVVATDGTDISNQRLNLTPGSGDYVIAQVSWNPGNTTYGGWVQDVSTGVITSTWQVGVNGANTFTGDSVEAIAERPLNNGSPTNLSNFKTMTFEAALANGSEITNYPRSSLRDVNMTRNGQRTGVPLATPSTLGGPVFNSTFAVTMQNCN